MHQEQNISRVISLSACAIFLSLAAGTCAAQAPFEIGVPTGASHPGLMTKGPDGNVWFTEVSSEKIGSITLGGKITEYQLSTSGASPYGITPGPDGNLWFTENGVSQIGKITTGGAITEYPIPTSNANILQIVAGADGNLWFTENAVNKIGKITTSGTVTEYPLPSGGNPNGIAKGPDGNIWFTEAQGNKIGVITTAGVITEFTIPTAASHTISIAAGPDGNLWFAENVGGNIGRITPAGVITEFQVPTVPADLWSITAGPDGNLWFTENAGNKVGKITPSGAITEYPIPTSSSALEGITAGPDGNIWFLEDLGNNVGLIYPYGQAFAHLAVGPLGSDVWTTAIILNNTAADASTFMVNFTQDTGQPLALGLGIYDETHQTITQSPTGTYITGTIPAHSTVTEVLSSGTFAEGWATLAGPGISGQVVFHRHTSSGADYEATVPLAAGGTQFQVPFDATTYFNGAAAVPSLPYITGMALANLDPARSAIISCTVLDPNGVVLGSANPITLASMNHTALQLNAASGFANVGGNIGSLNCVSNGPLFSVLGLRFLGGNDLTSFAAIKLH